MHIDPPKRGSPRGVSFYNKQYGSSGIQIQYNKSHDEFYVSGWYDSMVGIEGGVVSRTELFAALGIE